STGQCGTHNAATRSGPELTRPVPGPASPPNPLLVLAPTLQALVTALTPPADRPRTRTRWKPRPPPSRTAGPRRPAPVRPHRDHPGTPSTDGCATVPAHVPGPPNGTPPR